MCSMISKENTRFIKDKSILKHEFFTGMIWVVLTCEKKTQIQKDLDTSNQRVPWWKLVLQTFQLIIYLDLPKGPKWFLKGVKSPSLRVWLLGRCWYQSYGIMIFHQYMFIVEQLFRTVSPENSLFSAPFQQAHHIQKALRAPTKRPARRVRFGRQDIGAKHISHGVFWGFVAFPMFLTLITNLKRWHIS